MPGGQQGWHLRFAAASKPFSTPDPDASAVILALCDQPRVTADVISALAATYERTHAPLVASSYGGSFGVPALFSRSIFGELTSMQGADTHSYPWMATA